VVDLGRHDVERIRRAVAVVASPGVPPDAPPLAAARAAGVPIVAELDLGFQALRGTGCIAVSGTNGKTTVTALVAHLLEAGGVGPERRRSCRARARSGSERPAHAVLGAGQGGSMVRRDERGAPPGRRGAAAAPGAEAAGRPQRRERPGGGARSARRRRRAGAARGGTALVSRPAPPPRAGARGGWRLVD